VRGALREPMFALLAAAAGVYVLIGEPHEAAVLVASLVVVVGLAIAQERKAERALAALRDLSSPRALVRRDGVVSRIPGVDVVRGDVVLLVEGDRVPADARLLAANDLELDESLLTGESLPVRRLAGEVHSGTLVVRGQGEAEVLATGAHTRLGRIGASLQALQPGETRLAAETRRIVRLVAAGAAALSCALALAYGLQRDAWLDGALAGLTLAMAILPEEFPLVLTVFLALGAWRIARHGVLTRHMPALETLGAATVLCVDKTGTLTQNRMTVAEVLAQDRSRTLLVAALACERDPFDPMERAILAAAPAAAAERRATWTLERDYPFGRDFLAVCHVWRSPAGERLLAVKGAAETVLKLCADAPPEAMAAAAAAAARGLRMLAVAEAAPAGGALPDDPRRHACRWLGLVGLADPLRPEVPEAVAQCRRAGIRVVMITGDYRGTALAIARQAGIDERDVHARVQPEEKLRLVQALKAQGEVVAMKGDGVNDAPALKAAHIGIAMGGRGSDVARESAALVLTGDDFGSIVASVRLGRRIYENIRNAMRYVIAVHVPIAGAAFAPLVFGWPPLLLPVHVMFLEFLIDPACSIAFEAEPSDAEAMRRPPRDPHARLFSPGMAAGALVTGGVMLAALLAACAWAAAAGRADEQWRTLGFAAIVFGNLGLILAGRSRERPLLATLSRQNMALWLVVGAAFAALLAAIYLPPLAALFRFAPLGAADLAVAAASGLAGLAVIEAGKGLRARAGRAPA
jgi:Ca2+-transporting ATPase